MSLHITDDAMTSDLTPHTAQRRGAIPEQARLYAGTSWWEVTWLPGRVLDRNQAITAMILAEYIAAGIGDHTDARWPFIHGWAAELGLSGAAAVGKISDTAIEQPEAAGHPEARPCGYAGLCGLAAGNDGDHRAGRAMDAPAVPPAAVTLDAEQLRTVLDALADGAAYRRWEAGRWCSDCETSPAEACETHLDDLDAAGGYESLLRQLRQEAGR